MNVPITIVHVLGGTGALLSGAAALCAAKGGSVHRQAGTTFFYTMMLMTVTGTTLAVLKPSLISVQGGTITFYLVATSWATARRGSGEAGAFERLALGYAVSCVLLGLLFAGAALRPGKLVDGVPWIGYLPFAAVAVLCAALDLRFILLGRLPPQQRIARHVWRMSVALLIAAMSFFIGQQKVMPVSLRGSPLLLLPPLAVIVAMTFWLVRLRFGKGLRGGVPALLSRGAGGAALAQGGS